MDFNRPIAEQFDSSKLSEGVSNASNQVSRSVSDMGSSVTSTLNEFSSKSVGDASAEFLQSNSIIARFVFLILVLIGFMVLLNLGIMLLGYIFDDSENPYLVYGTMSGGNGTIISQDPKHKKAIPISRSNNKKGGIEFTWSTWLLVDNINPKNSNRYQHVFNKGNGEFNSEGIATINNAPGLYIDNHTGGLRVIMDNVNGRPHNFIDVQNIPLKKWFHVLIRVENTSFDLYVNGTIKQRVIMEYTPKQNYGDVYIAQNGGFSGSLADLRYYSSALSIFDILSIVNYGHHTNTSGSSNDTTAANYPYYLSQSWYSS